MKIQVHLISMPWAAWNRPSIQTSCLKAYIDQSYEGKVACHTYSAHFSIPWAADLAQLNEQSSGYPHKEIPFLLLYLMRYASPKLRLSEIEKILTKYNRSHNSSSRLTLAQLKRLERSTRAYLDQQVLPQLKPGHCELVGFTLNYDQVYASMYAIQYLREQCPDAAMKFLLGGMSAISPHVVSVLKRLGIDAYCVIGEGEGKLKNLIDVLSQESIENLSLSGDSIISSVAGVTHLSRYDGGLLNETLARTQFQSLDFLPLPNYDEYFKTVHSMVSPSVYADEFSRLLSLPMEGSRGCFAACDFCGLNVLWDGFRKQGAKQVVDRTLAAVDRYGIQDVSFMDNVCDTWAEKYSEAMIERRLHFRSVMELRAHHPEQFWTKLNLAGVNSIQVGIEALSPDLLKHIRKGTKVIQNVAAQKYLTELGIESGSNIITYHPRSTCADVEETKRILTLISHMQHLFLAPFSFVYGSPLYNQLPERARASARPIGLGLHPRLDEFFVDWLVELTEKVDLELSPETRKAWADFSKWHEEHKKKARNAKFSVTRVSESKLRFIDSRFKSVRSFELTGDDALIYDLCHRGPRIEYLVRVTGFTSVRVESILSRLVAEKLILQTEQNYLSLALRPKVELILAYLDSQRQMENASPQAAVPIKEEAWVSSP